MFLFSTPKKSGSEMSSSEIVFSIKILMVDRAPTAFYSGGFVKFVQS